MAYLDLNGLERFKEKNDAAYASASEVANIRVGTNVRSAILALFEAAAYAETGLTDEIAVIESWAAEVTELTLSASTLSLNGSTPSTLTAITVPSGSAVSWSSSDTSIATVVGGVVTGVSNGSCTITASAGDLSATCSVTVSGFATLESISAVYTQSGTVYDTDSLDDLKADLVVTATYSDSTTATVTDYTLSGTLTEGTSTITVSYGGKTTTFTVTVTHNSNTMLYNWDFTVSDVDSIASQQATRQAHSSYTAPALTTAGIVFDAPTQVVYLGEINLVGKTIEIDVASFEFAGNSSYHVRFLINSDRTTASNAIGSGTLIYRSSNGWTEYGYTDSDVTHTSGTYRGWSSTYWGDIQTQINAFNGKTVKVVYNEDGHTITLYLDSTLIGTISSHYFNGDRAKYLYIGGAASKTQSSGDQCYNMTISGVRIYENE